MLDTFEKNTMNATTGCKANEDVPKDAHGRCYIQDPMEGGHGNRDDGQLFQIFSDFHVGKIQRYFEGRTAQEGRVFNNESYSGLVSARALHGGVDRAPVDPDTGVLRPGALTKWDAAQGIFVPHVPLIWDPYQGASVPCSSCKGANLLNFAASRGVPVVKIIISLDCIELGCHNNSGAVPHVLNTSAGLTDFGEFSKRRTTIYQVLQEAAGDALVGIDADDAEVLPKLAFDATDAPFKDYGKDGLDFLLAVTFADGSVKRVVVPGSFRPSWNPTASVPADAGNPASGKSFMWAGAALESGGRAVTGVELLYAPLLWKRLHNRQPQLVAAWSAESGELQLPAVAVPSHELLASLNETGPEAFRFDVTIRNITGGPCAVSQSDQLAVALEAAVFGAVNTAAAALPVPPSTTVAMRCACNGVSCPADCTNTYLKPAYDYSSTSVTLPLVR
jgi:hypothetical protein